MAFKIIPRSNSGFNDFQDTFVNVVNDNIATFDFSAAATLEWKLLTNTVGKKKKNWDAIWPIIKTKVFTHADEVRMVETRKDYESGTRKDATDTSLRLFIKRYIINNPLVTSEMKVLLGLTVPDDIKTERTGVHGFHPGNDLSGKVRSADHLVHWLKITIPSQKSKAKPPSVKDIQIFMALTELSVTVAPALSAFGYIGVVQGGLFTQIFDITQEGKRAWYYARFMYKGKMVTYGPPCTIWNAIVM